MNQCKARPHDAATSWYTSVKALPLSWDTGLQAADYLCGASLAAHEAICLPDVTHQYAALQHSDGRIIARAAFQILSLKPAHVRRESLPRWQWNGWTALVRTLHPKLLVGGHLFRHDVATMQYDEGTIKPYDAFVWYREVIRTAMRRCGVQAVLLKEPPAPLVPLLLHHAPEYLLLRADSSMQMRIPAEWESLKDYEKSLKHKYAQRFRKVRQAWASLEVRELDKREVEQHGARIFALYSQVASHQSVRVGMLNEAFLPGLKTFYGDELKVWGIWEGETLIAFASAWAHRDRFDMFYIGFDYARNAELQLYFNILFFAVEQAISHRAPLLILGRTALEAKARVGCRPVYLNTFLHIRSAMLRKIVNKLQAGLSTDEGTEWEQRHPFKSNDSKD